jgi:hypothetical protein
MPDPGKQRSAFPKARVVALAECGTHAFLAAEVGAYGTGEKTLAQRLYPRLRGDELLTADRGFYSWAAWDLAAATGTALLWRVPTQLTLPVVAVLPDGTYLTVLISPKVRGAGRRRQILAAAEAGQEFLPLLAERLDDEVPEVRYRAAALLACLGSQAAAYADQLAAGSTDAALRDARTPTRSATRRCGRGPARTTRGACPVW